jgi:hypothetical protein
MYGRYGRRADKQRIAKWFETHNTDVFNDEYYEINHCSFAPSYNISPDSGASHCPLTVSVTCTEFEMVPEVPVTIKV